MIIATEIDIPIPQAPKLVIAIVAVVIGIILLLLLKKRNPN